jgi:hypothetical protein
MRLGGIWRRDTEADIQDISARRSPGGGRSFQKNRKRLSFQDIVEAIEGPLENSKCVFGSKMVFTSDVFSEIFSKK